MLARIRQFIAPPQFPDDDEKSRVANLLNTVLWMLFVLFFILAVAITILSDDVISMVSFSLVAAVNLVPLFFLRRKYLRFASWFVVVVFFVATVSAVTMVSGLTLGSVSALMVLVVLAGLLLGRLPATVFVILSIIVTSIVMHLQEIGRIIPQESSIANIFSLAATFILLGIALNLTLRDLYDASGRMRRSNEELLAIREGLEQTVAERTRDLELAAEIGRSVSQIRELDVLLQDAVNIIQKRFGLYYAQIYLTDKQQKTLSLKAGTGIVGRQLVRRGHVLSVSTGSINGTATAQKKTVLVPDTAASPLFKPNSLLPFTRSEMAVPLILADRVLGVLNLQSDVPNGLTQENTYAFETLAGQLAVAIENANLFAETQEARAQVEEYVGVVVREGWENYQNGIDQPELLGFSFAEDTLQRLTEIAAAAADNTELDIPIVIANETIGTIQLEAEQGHVWTEEEKEMITAVARQVGQQAENLRLLAESAQYRAEAEQFARRLSGEAWREFAQERGAAGRGFVYDQNEIQPLSAHALNELPEADVLRQPLQIQSEDIGEIVIAGAKILDDAGLVAAVSEQLSSHIENLRLAQQTETALAQTDSLYRIGRDLNSANNVEEILLAALRPVMGTAVSEATLMFVELDAENEPETLELLADWQHESHPSYQIGARFPVQQFPFAGLFLKDAVSPQLISDVLLDARVDEFTRNVMTQAGIRAIAVIPLTVAQQWVGIITCSWSTVHTFTKQEKDIFSALINMAAPSVQSQRLYAKTKSQADKEHLINVITQRIQGTVTIDSALQTAVKELGQALQTTAQVKLTTTATKQENQQPESVAAD